MAIHTIIGQAARGEAFFPRPEIINDIWEKIKTGSNLLLVAPRRVGKSSILFNLLDEPCDNRIVIYYTSESVNNENEFYKKLYHHIMDKLSGIQKYRKMTGILLKDLISRIDSISMDKGINFGACKISYFDELNSLVRTIDFGEESIVVLIDEFAQTVENISRDEDEKAAVHFLETNRVIRQAPEIHKKLQFIYAGSIGLENIVSRMNYSNLINDLVSIRIKPLKEKEVEKLIENILDSSEYVFAKEAYLHLLDIVEWWIPFYFQIIFDEVNKILTEENIKRITVDIVDISVKNALEHKIYFEQWFTRLRKAYQRDEFSFLKELLNFISEKKKITSLEIHDLAIKYGIESGYKNLINALKYDGYINNHDDPSIYRFNSYLLREWWRCNVAN